MNKFGNYLSSFAKEKNTVRDKSETGLGQSDTGGQWEADVNPGGPGSLPGAL